MKIYVCIKQVPNTNDVKIDAKKGTLIRKNIENIVNPADKNALEIALKIKDIVNDVEITIISMGPLQAKESIQECLAMGADKAILLSDRAFSGADTFATSYVLSQCIKILGIPDIILLGKQAIDGETAQVGPQLAEKLDIQFETSVKEAKYNINCIDILKETEEYITELKVKLPCLLTVNKDANIPRNMNIFDIRKKKEPIIFSHEDINLKEYECGIEASPTKVIATFLPPKNNECIFIDENNLDDLIDIIKSI